MNVWIHFLYWTESYPTGPDDARCTSSSKSRVPLPEAPAITPIPKAKAPSKRKNKRTEFKRSDLSNLSK